MKQPVTFLNSTALAACMAAAAALTGTAHAVDDYPTRPVRVIVPFPPGGSDTVARIVAQALSDKLGWPFVVDNRVGAASIVGTALAARAPADGYSILFTTATFAISAATFRNLPYDPLRDFVAVAPVSSGPLVLVVPPSLPVKSVKDLIALAKSKPGQLNYASGGEGGINHITAEMFKSMAGVDITHIPYKGSGPAKVDLLAGRTQMMIDAFGSSVPLVNQGKLRALAVTSAQRTVLMPALPTIAESGVPGYEARTWYGMLAPRGMPSFATTVLSSQINAIVKNENVREQLAGLGFEPLLYTPKQFADFVRSEIDKWSRAAKKAGISIAL